MSDLKVIYEFITNLDYIFIKKYLKERFPVFVVEPFHAYHNSEVIRFFPPHQGKDAETPTESEGNLTCAGSYPKASTYVNRIGKEESIGNS